MIKNSGKIFALVIALQFAGTPYTPVMAESLQQKYGPDWTCRNIDISMGPNYQNQLRKYDFCRECERAGKEFDPELGCVGGSASSDDVSSDLRSQIEKGIEREQQYDPEYDQISKERLNNY